LRAVLVVGLGLGLDLVSACLVVICTRICATFRFRCHTTASVVLSHALQ